jgi:sugar-specific transcriptional regulator TrmB
MHDAYRAKLESLGLSSGEAQVYLVLLRSGGTLGASALAAATRIPRTGVYPLLHSLVQKGIVEAEAGYGSRFTIIPPTRALPALIARERDEQMEKLLQRERLAGDLVEELESALEPAPNNGEAEVIQVLRDPRVFGERFEQLQEEAKQQIDVFIKAPLLNPSYGNPAQQKAMKRGVLCRGLYEKAIMDVPEIKASLSKWITAGEIARLHDGELPHKVAIFDRQSVLVPLVPPQPGRVLFLSIRNSQLAASLGMLFDLLWERAEPIACDPPTARRKRSRKKSSCHLPADALTKHRPL